MEVELLVICLIQANERKSGASNASPFSILEQQLSFTSVNIPFFSTHSHCYRLTHPVPYSAGISWALSSDPPLALFSAA